MPRLPLLPALLLIALLAGCQSAPITLHDADLAPAAVATVVLPEQLEVTSVNGVEVEGASGMLTKGDKTLELAPGRYEILVFYRELWETGDSHDVLRSDPALFVIDAAAGSRYRVDYARPDGIDSARALTADFRGWVEDLGTGERVPSRASGLEFRRGLVPALTFDDTLVPAAAGGGQPIAPLPEDDATGLAAAAADTGAAERVPPSRDSVPVPGSADPAMPEGSWLDLMKSFWSEASMEERRAFLRWLAEQR